MKELKELWSKQSFRFTTEQKEEYDRLLKLRRERVKYMCDNGLVWKGGVTKPTPEINPKTTDSPKV